MKTVVLKVNENVMERFMWLLDHFKKDEVDVVDQSFLKTRAYLENEMNEMENGAVMIDEADFWKSTENVLSKYE